MAVDGQEIREGLSEGEIGSGLGIKIGDDDGFQEIFVLQNPIEHQFAEGRTRCGLYFGLVIRFQTFGEDLEDGFACRRSGGVGIGMVLGIGGVRGLKDGVAVGYEDIAEDMQGVDLKCIMTFVEAVKI